MDDIFVLWPHDRESLVLFLDYINTPDPTQKIKPPRKLQNQVTI